MIAKIAATLAKPHGLIYIPAGSEKDFVAPLAVELIPGVGPKTHKTLVQRGIKTIGDLLQNPALGERYLDLAESGEYSHAHDHSIGNETTLDKALKEIGQMEKILWELVEEVGGRLRGEELFARCLTVKIRYSQFPNHHPLAHPAVTDLFRQRNLRSRKPSAKAKCQSRQELYSASRP